MSLISIDNVPTLYQNKYSRVNYLPTQFRYLESGEYRYEANTNIFWITEKAFDLWVFQKACDHVINKLLKKVGLLDPNSQPYQV